MELGFPNGVSSLGVFADGTVDFYISTGGGIREAGENKLVREAGENFLTAAEANLADLGPAADTPLPKPDHVRFYIRTFEATLTADADEKDLRSNHHKLSPLFRAGHAVITKMRYLDRPKDDA